MLDYDDEINVLKKCNKLGKKNQKPLSEKKKIIGT